MGFFDELKQGVQGAVEASHAAAKAAHAEARTKANAVDWKSALMMFLELGNRWDAQASVRAISRWRCKSEAWGYGYKMAEWLRKSKIQDRKALALRVWWDLHCSNLRQRSEAGQRASEVAKCLAIARNDLFLSCTVAVIKPRQQVTFSDP
jgi:hypothetical protein